MQHFEQYDYEEMNEAVRQNKYPRSFCSYHMGMSIMDNS